MKKLPLMLAAAMFILVLAPHADAGWPFGRHRAAACGVPVQYQAAPQPVAMQAVPIVGTVASGGDFLAWLNQTRGAYGLPAVWYDPNLEAWAAENSRAGFGHAVRFGRRQNAAVAADMGTVCALWLASPPHADALLDPTITRIGIACVGMVWTVNLD